MLSKDQALAAADALIHRVETERRQRLERRTAFLVRLYPVLRNVLPEERQALVQSAWKSPKTRWVMGAAVLVVVLIALWALLGWPSIGLSLTGQHRYSMAMTASALLVPVQYLCIRAFLRRQVPIR